MTINVKESDNEKMDIITYILLTKSVFVYMLKQG